MEKNNVFSGHKYAIFVILAVLVGLIVLVVLYNSRFVPLCGEMPYVYMDSTNQSITNNEGAKTAIINYIIQKNPDSKIEQTISEPELKEISITDKNHSYIKKEIWVFERSGLAVDFEGEIYYKLGCY